MTVPDPQAIQFVLISHTNNGKTTLARTLTGVDVGEVRDAAHVTVLSESHTLLATPEGDALTLWDTPGFGDSVRLLRRLALTGNPIGWFLREVFDRYRDRAFWLSQNALRSARDSADVVLYLVNSTEDPRDAGYIEPEMKILEWLGKPVLVLLNQLGPPQPQELERAEQGRWREHLSRYPLVKDVLALDAFARCWVHERVFYEAVTPLLAAGKQEAYRRLLRQWESNNEQRFSESMHALARHLAAAALDVEAIDREERSLVKSALQAARLSRPAGERAGDKAMAAMIARHDANVAATTRALLALHKLDAREVGRINQRVRDNFSVRAPVDKAQAGLLGAIVSGAATGLGADLMAGGLTMGAGALIGGVMGALTMAGAAWAFNSGTDRNHPTVRFADEFLQGLLVSSVLRYLAVAHFGRGRGDFVEGEAPAFWKDEVERSVRNAVGDGSALWRAVRVHAERGDAIAQLDEVLTRVTRTTLAHLYPQSDPAPHRAAPIIFG
ncbi:DUF3482 domain-containing protein [Pseudoduganella sp. GCM10020061]|uniref:DUF3482 domain-containing protein n=1 Tax=Pseudoduganella sp. GCM10020061 TaxID=3317345 RepID=UPI0036300547